MITHFSFLGLACLAPLFMHVPFFFPLLFFSINKIRIIFFSLIFFLYFVFIITQKPINNKTSTNMLNKTTTIALFFFAFLLSLTSAIVINPTITTPNSGTKWRAGGQFTVKWDTTYDDGTGKKVPIPSTYKGDIKLGYLEGSDYNEHLLWDLASGFDLNKGSQQITLPADLVTRTGYIIVLMGDSGNASPKFTIRASK
jgi:hypothetical protein